MSERWYQKYVQLAFRIDKAVRKFTDNPFVDAYYGPIEWKVAVENEAEKSAFELVRAAMELVDEITQQGFEAKHAAYLGKQLMEPWVQGPDRLQVFRRFLMEEITPTDLLRQG